jgi:hypothetical protein
MLPFVILYVGMKLPFHSWKSPEIAWGEIWTLMANVLLGFYQSTYSKPITEFYSYLAPCDFRAFQTMKMELQGKKFRSDQRSATLFREMGGAL